MTITLRCTNCGERFSRRANRIDENNYCSNACKRTYQRSTGVYGIEISCSNCGNKFTRERNRIFEHNYCSRQCMKEFRRTNGGGTQTFCGECGKEMWIPPSRAKKALDKGKVIYCSWKCKNKHYVGKDHFAYTGRFKNYAGYIVLRSAEIPVEYMPMVRRGDSILEHRLVMAQYLGRVLEDWEINVVKEAYEKSKEKGE